MKAVIQRLVRKYLLLEDYGIDQFSTLDLFSEQARGMMHASSGRSGYDALGSEYASSSVLRSRYISILKKKWKQKDIFRLESISNLILFVDHTEYF